MAYPNIHAARITTEQGYDSFSTEKDELGEGIDAIYGIKGGKQNLQAIQFAAGKYSAAEARAWLKERQHQPILFEPASGGSEKALAEAGIGKVTGVEMIRVGQFKDMNGKEVKIEQADLDQMADNFGKARDVAMVLGHKVETDTPAVGWLDRVYRVGDKLLGDVGSIPARIAEAINQHQYRKVSLGLNQGYKDVKGWVIRHVGLLGANPPAVDGLADFPMVSFAADDAVSLGVESDFQHGEVKTVTRIEAVKMLQDAKVNEVLFAATISDEVVIALAEEVKRWPKPEAKPANLDNGDVKPEAKPEAPKPVQIDPGVALSEEVKVALAEAKALKEEFHAKVIEARKDRLAKVLELAVKQGRMIPAEVAGYQALAEGMIEETEKSILLADGKSKTCAFDAILAGIDSRPKMNVLGEMAPEKVKEEADSKRAKVEADAKAYFAANKEISTAMTEAEFVEGMLLNQGFEVDLKKEKSGK